ncbi:unnamed protein product, partial [marine sediment metagenome]
FCKLDAIQINPTIDTSSIKNMKLSHEGGLPDGVAGVAYHRPKIGLFQKENKQGFFTLENVGYAVVILKQQPNENEMPEIVEGDLSAHIRYDAVNSFGLGLNEKLIPVLSDDEWRRDYQKYAIMDGEAYVRVDYIDGPTAKISIYRDVDTRYDSMVLRKGQASGETYLPGFQCNAGFRATFLDAKVPETTAKLLFDGNEFDVYDNEKFADGLCRVVDIDSDKFGAGDVTIRCGRERFALSLEYNNIELEITDEDGKTYTKDFSEGDVVYEFKDGDRQVVLES